MAGLDLTGSRHGKEKKGIYFGSGSAVAGTTAAQEKRPVGPSAGPLMNRCAALHIQSTPMPGHSASRAKKDSAPV